jgi:hypothetical protein
MIALRPIYSSPSLAADSPLIVGLVPSMIIGDHKESDHAIAPGEYLGKDRVGWR